jgi:ATP-binding cassette subfamily B protein
LNFLGFVYREIKGSLANIEQMFTLLKKVPKVLDADNARELSLTKGAVSFENISFYYDKSRPILKNVSFEVKAGQKVAVVGESGSGKSTLVKLLFRFYDCQQGAIKVDNDIITEITQNSLRKNIGIVPQDTVLFNDSLFENVKYGNTRASKAQVEKAVELSHLSDFIASLPKGYETVVGERGLKLSGGEKQRVAIARTILKNPAILVFDEATSSLDSHSEQAILKAIKEVAKDHTSLVIAHRLSTIVDADNIIVLHKGEIIEQGDHQTLLSKQGHYANMWQLQQNTE